MGPGSSLSDGVVCYNVDKVILDEGAIVSQFAILCTSSHDISRLNVPLVTAPIHLGRRAWVGMDAFVNMGTSIGEFAVVASRANVVKDVEAWSVVGGNPAKFIKRRVLADS
jgi:putative colanic acid biosynthesis acetyltransferase WcaF